MIQRQQEEQLKIQQQQAEQMRIQQQQEEQLRIQMQQEEERRYKEEQLRIQQQEEQLRIQQQQEEQRRIQQQQEEQMRIQREQEEQARQAAEMKRQQEEAERQRQEQIQRQEMERQQQEMMLQQQSQRVSSSQISSSSSTARSGGFAAESRPEPLLSESQLAKPPMSSSLSLESSQSQSFAQQSSHIQQSSSSSFQSKTTQEVYESQEFSGGVMKGYRMKQEQNAEQRETGEKMLNTGVFGGIGGDNNSLVDAEFDYKKHSVKDLAKHFALVKPKADIPHTILPEQGSTMVTKDLHLTILEVPRVKWAQHLPHTLSQRRRCHRKTLKLLSWLMKIKRNSNKWNLRSLNPQSHLNLLLLKDQKLNRINLWSMKEDNLSQQVSYWPQLPLMQNLESSTHQQY